MADEKNISDSPNRQPRSPFEEDERIRNMLTNTMTLSPETFERIYLAPKTEVAGNLRATFANPTPIALFGFSVGLMPLSCAFMGWRGAGGNAVASTTCSLWFGGFLLILAGIGEFILGNTFPMMVFMGYGAHFLTFGTLFIPWFNAIGFFGANNQGTLAEGLASAEFANSFAFYPIGMMLLSFVYLVGSVRTNVCFMLIFTLATIGFGLGAGAYWSIGAGHVEYGLKLATGLGACFFGAMVVGWYLLLGATIAIMELPIPDLPIGDLSTVVKARPRGVPKQKKNE